MARSDLEGAVSGIVADLLGHWEEAEAAVDEAAPLVGLRAADIATDPLEAGSPEAQADDRRLDSDTARLSRAREALELDRAALRTLKTEALESFDLELEAA